MMKDTIANQLVKYLEARGVEHIFGLCGHTNIAVLAALSKSKKIKFVNTRHEQIAAHAADGYARATKQGVGRADAPLARAHQRGDRRGQRRARLDPDGGDRRRRADALLRQAPAPGSEPARGRVAVRDLPAVRQARVARRFAAPLPGDPREGVHARRERPARARCWSTCRWTSSPRRSTSRCSTRVLANNRALAKPVARRRRPPRRSSGSCWPRRRRCSTSAAASCSPTRPTELRELAEHLSLPVAHTLMGKGALPDDHPLILGMTGFWGTKFINDKCKGADWILGLGTRFSEADCSSWEPEYTFSFPPTKLIHIDIDPAEIGRNYPVAIGAVADLKSALAVLNRVARRLAPEGVKRAKLRRRDGRQPQGVRRRQQEGDGRATPGRCGPSASSPTCAPCCRATRSSAPTSAGTRTAWPSSTRSTRRAASSRPAASRRWASARRPRSAPRWRCPDKVVVALIGDGGFGQNPAALATAFEEDIAVVWVIMNNHAFGTIAGLEKAHYGTTFAHGVREGRQAVVARLRGDRPGLRRRGHQGALRRRVQAGAGEGDQDRSARSSSTST